jgi:NTE family protein
MAGTAFHAGVIERLFEDLDWDARDTEVIVGTSAGSSSAALLRAGLAPTDYVPRITGEGMSPEGQRLLAHAPPVSQVRPRVRRGWPSPASAALLRRAVTRPGRVGPGAALAAALPLGATPNRDVAAAIAPLHDAWPERPLWICAVRLDTGERVVFGRDRDAAPASVGEAVTASCAIPSFYEPPVIDGVRYVDGGVHSICNLDVMAGLGLDLVVVSAPMSTSAWVEPARDAGWRSAARVQLEREARTVRAAGTPVAVLVPDANARAAMRGASMDAGRRPVIARTVRDTPLASLAGADLELLERLRRG